MYQDTIIKIRYYIRKTGPNDIKFVKMRFIQLKTSVEFSKNIENK